MDESRNVIKALHQAIESGRAAAFVTVITVDGSTPREAGAKMLVYEDGSIEGTVGGGTLEAMAVRQAAVCLKAGTGGKFVFDLKPKGNTGMICMGRVEVFIDVYKNKLKLAIFGAGHVGVKIAAAAALAGFPFSVSDDRKEFANEQRFPGASKIIVEAPDKAMLKAGVDKDTFVVIVTRGHALDKECLLAALRTPARYIGMIGSSSKVGKIFDDLAKKGRDPRKDKRVYSPIGLDIGGKTPGEIAISVLAQVIMLHYGRGGAHMRDTK